MKDTRDGIEQLIKCASWVAGYVKGTLTDEEKTALLAWLENEDHWNIFERTVNEQFLTDGHALLKRFDAERALAKVKANPAFHRPTAIERYGRTGAKVIRFGWGRWIAVAASILVISATLLYINHGTTHNTTVGHSSSQQTLNDILPGKQGATLTLANGEKIDLNDINAGDVVNEAGITIRKTADGNLIYAVSDDPPEERHSLSVNALATAKGETYRVVLPDGSVIELNADSRLTYPSSFTNQMERKVTLVGEGYFQIAKDNQRPFVVETAGQQVLVLGTEFNIKAYPDEDKTVTTLVTGSLKVMGGDMGNLVLAPGEESVLNGQGIVMEKADLKASIAWRMGRFHFNKTPFDSMVREVARWYNVDVEYAGDKTPDIRFTGEMRRDVSLQTVLAYLEELGVNFRMEERKLVIE